MPLARTCRGLPILPAHQPLPSSLGDPLDPVTLVGPGLLAGFEQLAEAASTMDRAREVAADPTAGVPFAVVADRQVAGRGQRGARWWQAPGSLAVSLVVATGRTGTPPPAWSLACGVAVAEAIAAVEPAAAAVVRWPNDVEVAGRKLAGILVEAATGGRAIFGIGVNTTGSAHAAPAAIAARVATLPDITGRALSRQRLLEALVPRLLSLLAAVARDPAVLGERYRPLCALTGRRVTVHVGGLPIEGICQGIAADGRLVIDTASGRELIASGSLTPPADVWRGVE
jgi:BirA family biotin operon repressor/biotin-[acetyl-CoA-carboxylase] ligase